MSLVGRFRRIFQLLFSDTPMDCVAAPRFSDRPAAMSWCAAASPPHERIDADGRIIVRDWDIGYARGLRMMLPEGVVQLRERSWRMFGHAPWLCCLALMLLLWVG